MENRGQAPACHAMTRILLLQSVFPTPGHHQGNHSNWMADLALRQAVEVTKTLGLTDCLSRLQLQGGGLQKVLKPFVHLQGFSSKE